MKVFGGRVPKNLEGTLLAAGEGAGEMALDHLELQLARFGAVFEGPSDPSRSKQSAIMARGHKTLIPRFRTSAARYGTTSPPTSATSSPSASCARETFTRSRTARQLGGPRG